MYKMGSPKLYIASICMGLNPDYNNVQRDNYMCEIHYMQQMKNLGDITGTV